MTAVHRLIYLDYMATTPLDPVVLAVMLDGLQSPELYGNPSAAAHRLGWQAAERIERARQEVAAAIGAEPREIIWTSGATEADNLAIFGAARFYQRKGRHLITMQTEHSAVLACYQQLQREGFEVTYLPPAADGLLDLNQLAAALRSDTVLVSVMWVNNETGVIQDIKAIGELVHKQGALLHVDAAQAIGKVVVDIQQTPVDLMSLSAHKVYGPKGIGALYVRREPRVRLQPQCYGGGQEWGLRSGTLPTHQIMGMGTAFAQATAMLASDQQQAQALSQLLWQGLSDLGEVRLNGHWQSRVAQCLSVSIAGIDNDALLTRLPSLALSKGSACHAASDQPSHVLKALGLSPQAARETIRISLGRFTTVVDIEQALADLQQAVTELRAMSPLWDRVRKKLV